MLCCARGSNHPGETITVDLSLGANKWPLVMYNLTTIEATEFLPATMFHVKHWTEGSLALLIGDDRDWPKA